MPEVAARQPTRLARITSRLVGRLVGRLSGRLSARARFALACSLLILLVGILMLVVVSVVMRYVPTYNFTAAGPIPSGAPAGLGTLAPVTPPSLTPASLTPSSLTPATGTPLEAVPITASGTGIVISDVGDVLNTLFITSALALLVIGAFGAFLSWVIAGRMLRPLGVLTRAAEQASGGSLSHRVALAGPDDEFTRLSTTFDDMLDRLERSFTAHERFANHFSSKNHFSRTSSNPQRKPCESPTPSTVRPSTRSSAASSQRSRDSRTCSMCDSDHR